MILQLAARFRMGSTPIQIVKARILCQRQLPRGERELCHTLFDDEQPRHWVSLSAYWLDRTEVTARAYARCAAVRRCAAAPYDRGAQRFNRPDYPATFVDFENAKNYCRFVGKRLPTEAEFELAARGEAGRLFPWGNLYNSRLANHGREGLDRTDDSDGFRELAPIGSFPDGRTPLGFLDLAGNAAEWMLDRYAEYEAGEAKNPRGPAQPGSADLRVARGGHYMSIAAWLRGAARDKYEANARLSHLGFRCAKTSATHGSVSH